MLVVGTVTWPHRASYAFNQYVRKEVNVQATKLILTT